MPTIVALIATQPLGNAPPHALEMPRLGEVAPSSNDPDLLILDEPTTGVDLLSRGQGSDGSRLRNDPVHHAHSVKEVHEILANILVILAVFHMAAALVHHIVFGDNTLRRMLPRMRKQ
jgi:hypothetical protein